MITQDKIELNYARWIERLKKYGCYSERMIDEIGEDIKNASFALQENSGCAYQGAMLDMVLNNLCTLAYHINNDAFGENDKGRNRHSLLQVNMNMLMRVLLLQHIAKAEMFILQEQAWKAKNGYLYDFNGKLKSILKCGERSIYLCMKYGIELTEEEYEAMRILDKEDDKTNPYLSPLCQMVKMVNQLAVIESRQDYLSKNKQENNKEV